MIPSFNTIELDSFKAANSLLKGPSSVNKLGVSFDDVLETKAKEVAEKTKEKAGDLADSDNATNKKKGNKISNKELPNINSILQNSQRGNSGEILKTYLLLEKFKENKKLNDDEDLPRGARQQALNNA